MTDSPGGRRPDDRPGQAPISQTPWSTGLQDLQSWERDQQARQEQQDRPGQQAGTQPGTQPGAAETAPPDNPFTRPGARRGRTDDGPSAPTAGPSPAAPRRSAPEPTARPYGGPPPSGPPPSGPAPWQRPSAASAPSASSAPRQEGPVGPPAAASDRPVHQRPVAPQPMGDQRTTTPSTPPRRMQTGADPSGGRPPVTGPAVPARSADSASAPPPGAGRPVPATPPTGRYPQPPVSQTSAPPPVAQPMPQSQPSAPQGPPPGYGASGYGAPASAPYQPGPQTQPSASHPPAAPPAPGSAPIGIAPQSYSANDLINHLNPESPSKARKGLRGRLGLAPSGREQAEQADEDVVRTPFDRPVTVMIANPKGGVGKTPTTLMLASAFGVVRGGGVVAWDNNELRGTMPDRSLSPHRRTVRDILEASDHLRAPQSQFTDLSYFLNHQTTGKFHTLGSAQNFGHVISREDFEVIHGILTRYFQIVIVDTGNNEASPNWLAAAHSADCLVVPTKWRKDSLIPAARMLETLQEERSELLQRTVVVATNGPMDSQEEVRRNASTWFGGHQIVEIPTDPHVAEGGVIEYTKLRPRTKREMLRLAAQVARILSTVAAKPR